VELLERDNFLALLDEYARDAAGGDSRVVLVAGEAGVGKTALVEELHRRRPEDRWLWGACDGSFTPQPLAPLLDVADHLGGELAELCRSGEPPRGTVFRLLRDELTASEGLTVLVFEDVHWADEASLDLIQFLSRRVRDCRLLIVTTYRDDALVRDHPLRTLLGEVGTHRWARRISLPPLSPDAVTTLAQAHGADGKQVYELTGGNPFYVREALATSGDQLLTSVHDAVQARICRLSSQARELVDWVAVLGSSAKVSDLERLTIVTPDVLDECVASGALVASPDSLRFRHELARAAIESAVPAHRRRTMNSAVLRVLVERGDVDDARLAHHAELAEDAAAVLLHAPRAGEQAAHLGSHREAAAQFERALRWAGGAEPGVVAALRDRLADEYGLLDQWERSAQLREQAVACWRQLGNRRRESEALRKLSHAQWRLCDGEAHHRLADEALAVLDGEPPCPELGWALNNRASFMTSERPRDALEPAQRAVALAEEFGDTALLSEALNTEACARWYLGEDAGPMLRRALDVGVAGSHQSQIGRAFSNLHSFLSSRHHWDEAEEVFAEGLGYWELSDFSTYEACLKGGHIRALERQGRWDETLTLGREIVARAREFLSPVNRLNPLQGVGRVLARRGDPEGAEMLGEALALARQLDSSDWLADSLIGSLELAWLSGDERTARQLAQEVVDLSSALDPDFLGEEALWLTRVGVGTDHLEVPAPYAFAITGDNRAAARQLDELRLPYEAAMTLLDSGEPDAMREALVRLDALGAPAVSSRARQVMRRQGVAAIPRGSRASTRDDPLGLTAREREVLTLVCDGASNAQIADRLVISAKTVDHHVSAILGKLGVTSRADAARVALAASAT
jgi:DNA-binding CsgD family transcriptional regulator/tetratricopeptide (TPR) repeat protein